MLNEGACFFWSIRSNWCLQTTGSGNAIKANIQGSGGLPPPPMGGTLRALGGSPGVRWGRTDRVLPGSACSPVCAGTKVPCTGAPRAAACTTPPQMPAPRFPFLTERAVSRPVIGRVASMRTHTHVMISARHLPMPASPTPGPPSPRRTKTCTCSSWPKVLP